MNVERQGLRFVVVGAYNTGFGFCLFAAANLLFGHEVSYLILLVLAQIVATLNAYVAYRLLVFKVKNSWFRDLARFSVVYIAGLGINLALLPLFVEVLGAPVILSQGIITSATVLSTFFAHRHFSFRRPRDDAAATGPPFR